MSSCAWHECLVLASYGDMLSCLHDGWENGGKGLVGQTKSITNWCWYVLIHCTNTLHTTTRTGPDGCTEEFVGGMAVYGGFELDVLQSLVQYFNSLPDPLISSKLYELHMAVLRELTKWIILLLSLEVDTAGQVGWILIELQYQRP